MVQSMMHIIELHVQDKMKRKCRSDSLKGADKYVHVDDQDRNSWKCGDRTCCYYYYD